jgi:archaellum biogenesis ATPase FlaH
MNNEKNELDFPNEIIEKLLLKKIYSDVKYVSTFQNTFDKRWCANENISLLIYVIISFYKKYQKLPNKKIVSALLKKYIEKNSSIDYDSVINTFIETLTYNIEISDECFQKNISQFIKNRGLYFAIFDNINDIEKNKSIDKCLARFEKIQSLTFDDDNGLDYFNDMDQHWEYMLNPEARISTGYESIDRITHGGFLKDGRSLYIFMGQPGLGKSTFLSNIAHNLLKQNKTVVIISLEMSQDLYASRFDAHISGDNINLLRKTAHSSKEKIKQFFTKYSDARLFIKEYPPRSVRPSDIEIYMDKLATKGIKPDAIIVDYLNLILPQNITNDGANSYTRVLEVAEKLRALSYKYLAPVITATQANSEGYNSADIGMEHVSESKGINATCDFLAALYQVDDDVDNGIVNAKILKNRLGGKIGKVINFKLDPDTLVLDDISILSHIPNGNIENNKPDLTNDLKNIANDLSGLDIL